MELRVDFSSEFEWKNWVNENSDSMPKWIQRIVSSIEEFGFVEPITGLKAPANAIKIDSQNLRETISFNEMNSRKRGLLLEFQFLAREFQALGRRDCKIYAPEALSRTALVFRGRYPFFLGSEYLPDTERRSKMFPITHADLTKLDLPSAGFDLAYTQDVLEHVPSLDSAIRELARVLKPGGFLISTFPFAPHRTKTEIVAQFEDGKIVHRRPPEYHGDPLDPAGSLVFQIPAWDVLEMCRSAGLVDARMVLHASATHGVVSNGSVGVFVLSAAKSANVRPTRRWVWPAQKINTLVGVIGLPRSGTTMFSAVVDAHPDVVAIYEPWNATKATQDPNSVTVRGLIEEAEREEPHASTLVVKETTLDPSYPERVIQLLQHATSPINSHLFLLLRNPFHCFLSEIEGRRRWWGEADLQLRSDTFDRWCRRTIESYEQIMRSEARVPSSFVFYEACASRPSYTFNRVMSTVGLDFCEQQLNISTNADRKKIRGDISLVENTRDVEASSLSSRDYELERVRDELRKSQHYDAIRQIEEFFHVQSERALIGPNDLARIEFGRQFAVLVRAAKSAFDK